MDLRKRKDKAAPIKTRKVKAKSTSVLAELATELFTEPLAESLATEPLNHWMKLNLNFI